jgi:hypothetical protein
MIVEEGYLLYRPVGNGDVETVNPRQDYFDMNLLIVPKERVSEITGFLSSHETQTCQPSK